jgi:hypothetical protein
MDVVHCSAARQLLTSIESTGVVYGLVREVLYAHARSVTPGQCDHDHSNHSNHAHADTCSNSHGDLCYIIEAYTALVPSRCECSVVMGPDGNTLDTPSIMPNIHVAPHHVVTVRLSECWMCSEWWEY